MSNRVDYFFDKQPPLSFVDELRKPLHMQKPKWFGRTELKEGEVCASGAYIIHEFPDEEKLLETAIEDFCFFLSLYNVAGNQYPIRIVKRPTQCFEAFRIRIEQDGCIVEAEDTEGVRRALVYLEDEMHRREGAILPVGVISKVPVIRERITRGFYSPTNRPPKNVDELLDDVDYYPDNYLNRLAHDGTNGLWIYAHFHKLLTSNCFPEYGVDSDKRIAKLKRVVAKCKRYGIKVWIFGVEPSALTPDMAAKYPDAVSGKGWNGNSTICTYTEKGAQYCIEMTQRLMEQVPDLGGIIDITFGERPTTCVMLDDLCDCPRCRTRGRGEVLAHTVDLLKEGIRRAGSKAEFVSWTYQHRLSPMDEIEEYVRKAPQDVVQMENFEDAGYIEQLGKERQAMDYWLSYTGPSQMFEGAAQTALEEKKTMFAKMQVCCSHELATVPYIPVPGILFDKYAGAHKYDVKGVMQCWYFGNYPSLMSKAAGELAFMEDFSDKDAFLEHLAGIYYGSQAKQMVKAWRGFEKGYSNYPLNIMFSYYGPMHDGVAWELALLPKNRPLPRTWLLPDPPDGDRIGECLQSGHDLDEAILLTQAMKTYWDEGLQQMPERGPKEQKNIAKALSVLFHSGNNILRFYALREQLGLDDGNSEQILSEMEKIVEDEICNSREMIAVCREDSRLGYHSEAEGFKFFPEKLERRICQLQELKQSEFPLVRKRLAEGKTALEYYQGVDTTDPDTVTYLVKREGLETADCVTLSNGAQFKVAYDDADIQIELRASEQCRWVFCLEYRLMWPAPAIVLQNGKLDLAFCVYTHQSIYGERIGQELDKYELVAVAGEPGHYVLKISREKTGWIKDTPLKLRIVADGVSWAEEEDPVCTLGKVEASPGQFGWLLPQ